MQQILSLAKTDSAKLDGLVQVELGLLRAMDPDPRSPTAGASRLTWRSVFIAAPIVVVVVTFVYMAATCYPWAVFAWGDYEQHYQSLRSRRKFLWTVVILAVIIGLLPNLFVASLRLPP